MERFNKVRDPENDIDAYRTEKILEKHDGTATYKNNALKVSFVSPIIKNSKSGQRNFYLPQRLLKQVWAYYDLADFKMPNKLRIYIMFKISKKGGVKQ